MMTPEPLSEKDVAAACDALARACGYSCESYEQSRATRITEGLPDRRYVHPRGVRIWVELKASDGKLTRAQHAWLCAELAVGAHAIAVDHPEQLARVFRDLARDAGRGAALDYCRTVVAMIAAKGYRGERQPSRQVRRRATGVR